VQVWGCAACGFFCGKGNGLQVQEMFKIRSSSKKCSSETKRSPKYLSNLDINRTRAMTKQNRVQPQAARLMIIEALMAAIP
jgi:hypothetical protein